MNLADHSSSSVPRCEVFTRFLHVSSFDVFHDSFVLTLFSRILCRGLALRPMAEVGGQTSTGFWMMLVGSIASS
jgi:hypothetical protein